jgi:hypothetical protein
MAKCLNGKLILLFLLFVIGCGSNKQPVPTTSPLLAQSTFYVANLQGGTIARFDPGQATPSAVISGTSTTLVTPKSIFLDAQADRLYVADQNGMSISIFEHASTKSGNVTPDRSIFGTAAQLNGPQAVAVDTTRDLLFVSLAGSANILVFSNASVANGNVAPSRVLNLNAKVDIFLLDQANDRLFAADGFDPINAVDVYDGLSTLPSGAVTPNRTIAGASTGLNLVSGLALDTKGRLYVSNAGTGRITVYPSAATANGNVAPLFAIEQWVAAGGTPGVLAASHNTAGNTDLYVLQGSSTLIYPSIEAATAGVSPARMISVPFGTTGLAINPTH